ncbi:tRNA epoxyqueuosine(34) reductase QueG [Martelella lutilitoris]|uniref:Epoxyqueuosine reductase n=1 Tax=Martelella lutilitoris TaxID=2583532 RepID=A0A5C4JQQ7_9HYPH|nr:tRNA epoxyqueuosine(34) reductase QueG [Martelella lutilitoris]TNB47648.1 tRNA epoxyqueuosine(34) reductase QueG [Martelella lutilitoris]
MAERQDRLKRFLKDEARAIGFDACRIARADDMPDSAAALRDFVENGYHGQMAWMNETLERRSSPLSLWPEARSVIMLAMNYGPDEDPRPLLERRDRANISVYARNRDYHDVIKGKLKQMAGRFAARSGADVKVFVDTAPVMEKPLAEKAGIGWQGKHTNLVSRDYGSWLFLGSIFTTEALDPDSAEKDHCGSCRACLDVCPTDAFPAPYRLDARRCISYLTIEHHGVIPEEFRSAMGNRIYGCDDCLAACPWNKFAETASEMKLSARADLKAPELSMFLGFDDAAFRKFFTGSPVKRIGRDRFVRNCLIAAGNSGHPHLAAHCRSLLEDDSAAVRAMAVWALARLLSKTEFAALAKSRLRDTDEDVRREWKREEEVPCI